jgi:hypothetical protein
MADQTRRTGKSYEPLKTSVTAPGDPSLTLGIERASEGSPALDAVLS